MPDSAAALALRVDGRCVGHAYVELRARGEAEGTVYGFYPESFDGESEVLADAGEIRTDRHRLDAIRADDATGLVSAELPLDRRELARARSYLERARRHPGRYTFLGNNCIDFLQDLYRATYGEDAGHFTRHFDAAELAGVSATGWYALMRYPARG